MEVAEFQSQHLDHALLAKVRAVFPGAISRPYLANPDLVERFKHGWPLAEADRSSYYTRCVEVGYTDFPAHSLGSRSRRAG